MQTIGERLEEARKRLGLSLRDVSEATKIRTDYLVLMEDGSFDFPLPDVYKRGFLKIYGRHLKLDQDKLVADFNAQHLASARSGRREPSHLGHMEFPGGQGQVVGPPPDRGDSAPDALDAGLGGDAENRAAWIKVVTVVVVALVALILVIAGLHHLVSSSTDDTGGAANSSLSDSNTNTPSVTPPPAAPAAPAAPTITFVLSALKGNISNLTVQQLSDYKELYNNSLPAGKSITVPSQGPVKISVTENQYLVIQQDKLAPTMAGDPATGKARIGVQSYTWPPPAAPAPPATPTPRASATP